MRGCGGACMVVGGDAWLWGVCMVVGDVRGCWGVCVVARRGAWLLGGCVGYDEIWSMSGRYASYWNAFLFIFGCFKEQPIVASM